MGGLTPPETLAATDDVAGFDCGREALNQWLRRHAWRNQQTGVSRTSVMRDRASGAIAGYVALSAGQIARAMLAKPAQRNRPDPVPVLLLGQLAVDRRFQGRGVARSLLMFAFGTAVRFAREIGCFGVLTHPLDAAVRAFHGRFGFEALPFDPRGSMVVRIVEVERNGFG